MKTRTFFERGCHGLFLFLLISIAYPANAIQKKAPQSKPAKEAGLPVDPKVKIGKLPNGFTYYIRKNAEPKNRVVMYLVNKVGSILETDEQQGLAHFMEHMNFNGTTHFPKNELISYLQKSGVNFGGDLNAYTSFDETVYQLPLPTDDPELLKNGFLVMRDWAKGATLEADEIDKERGVILEEKRLGKGAQERLRDQYLPIITNQSRYSKRLPIGTEEVLKNFKRQTLVDFYNDWYRPNLQALIVVGDIDPKATEQTIVKLFSDLKNPPSVRPRVKYPIQLTGKNQYFLGTDKELTLPTIQVLAKYPHEKLVTRQDMRQNLCKSIFNYILGERFADLSKKPNQPFIQAGADAGGFMANIDVFSTQLTAEPQKLKEAFKTVWTEIERVKKYGFTNAEIARAKTSILKNYEYALGEQDKTNSADYVGEYTRNFLENEAISGIQYEVSLSKQQMAGITARDLKDCVSRYMLDTNRDILVLAPTKDKALLPSETDILGWMRDVQKTEISAISDKENKTSLIKEKPTGGTIVKQSKDEALNLTELTLSNGVKVYLKPTNFKNDEIFINAFSPGGTSLYPDSDYMSATAASEFVYNSGLGDFTLSELQKYLTGKRVSVSPYIGERNEGFSGMSSIADLETAFQMIQLYFEQPRKDAEIFKSELEKAKVAIINGKSNPSTVFADTIAAVLGNHNIRRAAMSAEMIDQIDLERSYQIYKDRFADASDFTFTLVGSFDVEKISPLIAQYLGSLPTIARKEEPRDLNIHIPDGKLERTVKKGIEKKSTVKLVFSGKYEYSPKENVSLSALSELLTIRLLETLREKESGVYGVSASADYSKYPENRYSINIEFGCAPENVEKLISATNDVIMELRKSPISSEEVQKVVAEDLRSFELQSKENGFWLGYISGHLLLNDDLKAVFAYPDLLKSISPASLKEAADKYLTGENYARFVLDPEN